MPRIRHTLRFPSYRNLQVYHSLAYERSTQTALAKRLGLSQVRLSQIAQQVRAWVDRTIRPRDFVGNAGMRFHLAIARERIRLHAAYEPLVAMFTGPEGWPRYLRRHTTVVGGEALNTLEISDKPDFRLLNQALDVNGRQAELAAIAHLGPFADLPNQTHQTIVHDYGTAASSTPHSSKDHLTPSAASSNSHQNNARGVIG